MGLDLQRIEIEIADQITNCSDTIRWLIPDSVLACSVEISPTSALDGGNETVPVVVYVDGYEGKSQAYITFKGISLIDIGSDPPVIYIYIY